eukprot:3697696-Rhodomonas_salina.1
MQCAKALLARCISEAENADSLLECAVAMVVGREWVASLARPANAYLSQPLNWENSKRSETHPGGRIKQTVPCYQENYNEFYDQASRGTQRDSLPTPPVPSR